MTWHPPDGHNKGRGRWEGPEARLNDPVWAESPEGQAYLEEHRKAERKRREWERRTAGRLR